MNKIMLNTFVFECYNSSEKFRFLSDSARGKISLCDVILISIVILIRSFSEKISLPFNQPQPQQSLPNVITPQSQSKREKNPNQKRLTRPNISD